MKPVVRNITNNSFYVYLGEDTYRNCHTGQVGVVPPEKASKVFKINVEMTKMLHEYPLIEKMIQKLDLKIEK